MEDLTIQQLAEQYQENPLQVTPLHSLSYLFTNIDIFNLLRGTADNLDVKFQEHLNVSLSFQLKLARELN